MSDIPVEHASSMGLPGPKVLRPAGSGYDGNPLTRIWIAIGLEGIGFD
ncbi:MAG: hypothetical protein AAFZ49_18750 [Cyanobacteria bacterium J06659_2]